MRNYKQLRLYLEIQTQDLGLVDGMKVFVDEVSKLEEHYHDWAHVSYIIVGFLQYSEYVEYVKTRDIYE